MKKVITLCLALLIGLYAIAQIKPAYIDKNLANKAVKVPITKAVDIPVSPIQTPNPYVFDYKSIDDNEIGTGTYDLQTNTSVQNRIYLYPDGTIGATWTFGTGATSFANRGTGYNYYDGSSWGSAPVSRIETGRCGWPSYAPLLNGEIVVSHNGNDGLYIATTETKGDGIWTTNTLIGPMTTGGTTALLWPRMITSNGKVHLLACTDHAESAPYYYYQGLALALVYYYSADSGKTFVGPAILPGMDSASIVGLNNRGFSGDSYSWAAPHGDTIAFVVGDSWGDAFVMKSYDGGTTWSKILVYDFPDNPALGDTTPIIASLDGSMAIALDNIGQAHVVAGFMRVKDSILTDDETSYYPYTDGLVYWNETMPTLDTAILESRSNLIAAMLDINDNDTLDFEETVSKLPFGIFYLSLTSMPQIIIDDNQVIYVSYSSIREDLNNGASPNPQHYRHLYTISSSDSGQTWCYPRDVTMSMLFSTDECIFGSMSFTSDDNLHLVFQADEEPGLNVRGDEDSEGTNRFIYLKVPKSEACGAPDDGIKENITSVEDINIYPNPADEYTSVNFKLNNSSKVKITITNLVGQTVQTKNYGTLNTGSHNLIINTSNFNNGIYFISLEAGNKKVTRKIVVN